MNATGDLLERVGERFPFPDDAFDRMRRRRDRARRNQRLVTAAVALVLAAAAIGSAIEIFRASEGRTPASPRITTENVGDLGRAWSADIGGAAAIVPGNAVARPTVVDGIVYVATRDGHVSAYDASCEARSACEPLWTVTVGSTVSYAPTVSGGVVYVTTEGGRLIAIPASCGSGGARCSPWVGELSAPASSSATVSGGMIYVSDLRFLYAFSVDCSIANRSCESSWRQPLNGGSFADRPFVRKASIYAPVVAGGEVLQIGADHRLFAFDATTGVLRWVGVPNTEVRAPHFTRYNSPVVEGEEVFASLAGGLYAFRLDCRTDGGSCSPLWSADVSEPYVGQPVASHGMVYVGTGEHGPNGQVLAFDARDGREVWRATEPVGDFSSIPLLARGTGIYAASLAGGRVFAFPPTCGSSPPSTCEPLWSGSVPSPEGMLLTGALLFVADESGTLSAFDTGCLGADCAPIWSSNSSGSLASAPSLADGRLFLMSADGTLSAYALGGVGAGRVGASTGSPLPFYLGLVGVVLIAVIIWKLRSRGGPSGSLR